MNIADVRAHFPALQSGAVFFDNPGGTQVPRSVVDAVVDYFETSNANTHGEFSTSRRTDAILADARAAFADFLNAASPNEIAFGANMTTLTFSIARALGRTLQAGDEILVTRLDHDADVAPWLALEEVGAVVKWVDIVPADCTLDLADFEKQLSPRTRLVAVGGASNAVGSINDLAAIIPMAHAARARVFVDAVALAPHLPLDVQALDCDLLACSVYKFYGPHVGVLYGKEALLDRLPAYKVRPVKNRAPDKFETGTLNHEGIAGALAAIQYLADLGARYGAPYAESFESFTGRRLQLKTAMAAINAYEKELFAHLMASLREVPGIHLYGITQPDRFDRRAPTLAFTVDGVAPREVADRLGQQEIYVWDGNYYALALMERLDLQDRGGAVRVGLAHYNTASEVDRFVDALKSIRG